MSSWKAFVRKVTPIIRVWATLTKAAERGETKQMWKRLEQATKRRFLLLPLFHPLATLLLGSLAYTFLFDWSVGSPLEPAFLNSFKENYTSLLSYQFFFFVIWKQFPLLLGSYLCWKKAGCTNSIKCTPKECHLMRTCLLMHFGLWVGRAQQHWKLIPRHIKANTCEKKSCFSFLVEHTVS